MLDKEIWCMISENVHSTCALLLSLDNHNITPNTVTIYNSLDTKWSGITLINSARYIIWMMVFLVVVFWEKKQKLPHKKNVSTLWLSHLPFEVHIFLICFEDYCSEVFFLGLRFLMEIKNRGPNKKILYILWLTLI